MLLSAPWKTCFQPLPQPNHFTKVRDQTEYGHEGNTPSVFHNTLLAGLLQQFSFRQVFFGGGGERVLFTKGRMGGGVFSAPLIILSWEQLLPCPQGCEGEQLNASHKGRKKSTEFYQRGDSSDPSAMSQFPLLCSLLPHKSFEI